jgi:hypothetical protein
MLHIFKNAKRKILVAASTHTESEKWQTCRPPFWSNDNCPIDRLSATLFDRTNNMGGIATHFFGISFNFSFFLSGIVMLRCICL